MAQDKIARDYEEVFCNKASSEEGKYIFSILDRLSHDELAQLCRTVNFVYRNDEDFVHYDDEMYKVVMITETPRDIFYKALDDLEL
jgi:hypothetical protein